jgi:hypothetical protein
MLGKNGTLGIEVGLDNDGRLRNDSSLGGNGGDNGALGIKGWLDGDGGLSNDSSLEGNGGDSSGVLSNNGTLINNSRLVNDRRFVNDFRWVNECGQGIDKLYGCIPVFDGLRNCRFLNNNLLLLGNFLRPFHKLRWSS